MKKLPELFSICFTNSNIGYVVGGFGIILKTIDSGATWTSLSSGTTNSLLSVFFTDSNIGYTVGDLGTILKTSTGGVLPTLAVSPSDRAVSSNAGSTYFIVNSNTSWIVSSDAVWCNVNPSGIGNDSIIADYSENNTSVARVATITVQVSGLNAINITVTQAKSSNGVENTGENNIQIYPNPTQGSFKIVPGHLIIDSLDVIVQDLNGKVILRKQFDSEKEYLMNLSSSIPGCYLLILKYRNQIAVRKLVIIR